MMENDEAKALLDAMRALMPRLAPADRQEIFYTLFLFSNYCHLCGSETEKPCVCERDD